MTLKERLEQIAQQEAAKLAIKRRHIQTAFTLAGIIIASLCGMSAACMMMLELDGRLIGSEFDVIRYSNIYDFGAIASLFFLALAAAVAAVVCKKPAFVFKSPWFWCFATPCPTVGVLVLLHSKFSLDTMLTIEWGICSVTSGIVALVVIAYIAMVIFGKKILLRLSGLSEEELGKDEP